MGPVEPNFFFTQHTVQFENATDFGSIVVDAKLVCNTWNPGGKIEPIALVECMAHSTSRTSTSKLKFVPPIV